MLTTFTIKAFLLLILSSLVWRVNGQFAIGIEGGYTSNYLNSHTGASYTQNNRSPGYLIGITSAYSLSRLFSVHTGVQLLQKNHSLDRTGPYAGIYQSFTNTYIQMPVMAQIQMGSKKISFHYKLGLYGAWWLSARMKGRIPNILNSYTGQNNNGTITDYFILTTYNEKYRFQSYKDRRLELGWLSAAGFSYRITTSVSAFVEGRYYHALTDQQKRNTMDHIPAYNQTYSICAGAQVPISHKKLAAR